MCLSAGSQPAPLSLCTLPGAAVVPALPLVLHHALSSHSSFEVRRCCCWDGKPLSLSSALEYSSRRKPSPCQASRQLRCMKQAEELSLGAWGQATHTRPQRWAPALVVPAEEPRDGSGTTNSSLSRERSQQITAHGLNRVITSAMLLSVPMAPLCPRPWRPQLAEGEGDVSLPAHTVLCQGADARPDQHSLLINSSSA